MPKLRAFTFIELMIVIAIVSIIATFGVVSFSKLFLQTEVISGVDVSTEALRKARYYALLNRYNSSWGVHKNSNNSMTIFAGNSYASRTTAYDETLNINSNITITGFSDIVFARLTGIPSTTAPYTITSTGYSRQIILSNLGAITE